MRGMRKILLCLLGAVLLGGCGLSDAARSGLGGFILLEGRNEAYYDQLSPQKGYSFHIPEGMETFGRTKNLILSVNRYMNHDGFTTVLNEDGSVTVNGRNDEKKVYLMIAGDVKLPAGRYVTSDGSVSAEDRSCYLQVTGNGEMLASLPGKRYFTFEEPGTVEVYIAVEADTEVKDLTFYPEICLASERDEVYDPCPDAVAGASGSDSRALLFRVDREALRKFTDDDRILFDNNLYYMYRDRFKWVSLLFDDGTGVQIVDCDPDKAVYGKMDIYGRVYEAS